MIKKNKLSTEGDSIHHCVITSQTKYSERLNLIQTWMISPCVETCSICFDKSHWREVVVSLYLKKSERPGGGSDLCGGGSLYIIYHTILYILNIIF